MDQILGADFKYEALVHIRGQYQADIGHNFVILYLKRVEILVNSRVAIAEKKPQMSKTYIFGYSIPRP